MPTSSRRNSEEERDSSTSISNSKKASKASQTASKSKDGYFFKNCRSVRSDKRKATIAKID